jgi:hypothetical protein
VYIHTVLYSTVARTVARTVHTVRIFRHPTNCLRSIDREYHWTLVQLSPIVVQDSSFHLFNANFDNRVYKVVRPRGQSIPLSQKSPKFTADSRSIQQSLSLSVSFKKFRRMEMSFAVPLLL